MKKILIALCLAVCLTLLGASAVSGEALPTEDITQVSEPCEDVTEDIAPDAESTEEPTEAPTEEPPAEQDIFREAMAFISAHFSGIITALAALYAVFPKWGGIAALLRVMQSLSAVIQRFGAYVDDTKNENSIYNVLCRQGERMDAFMGELSPVLTQLHESVTALRDGAVTEEKLRAVLLALEEGQELMAKEFSDLISISTTVPQKHKAELEEAFLRARAHLRESVREATGNDTAQKEASA